jgi:hypothetical protein
MLDKISRPNYLKMKPTLNQPPNFDSFPAPQDNSKYIIKCVIGIIIIVSGLFSILFFNSNISGLMRVIAGLLLIPPILELLEKVIKVKINRVLRYVTIIILVQVSLIISMADIMDGSKPSGKNKLPNADAAQFSNIDPIDSSQIIKKDTSKNAINLSNNDSISTDSLNKYAASEGKEVVGFKEHVAKQNEDFKDNYLSGWDGSFAALVKYVKDNMNDPDSFEHIETVFWNNGDHVVVIMKFRGKNAFDAKVVNIIKANVSWDGKIISIINQDE